MLTLDICQEGVGKGLGSGLRDWGLPMGAKPENIHTPNTYSGGKRVGLDAINWPSFT
jgi:hypothetical protein